MNDRDYFAMAALQAYLSKMPVAKVEDPRNILPNVPMFARSAATEIVEAICNISYRYADAMIEARERSTK